MCILHIMLHLLDTLLAPFARLMVAQGILFPDLAERLKAHYVDAASDQTDGKLTDSRLSVMTGLQRRDIVRIRDTPTREERPNHLATLVALWQTDSAYGGKPVQKNGPKPSFETLARSVRRDVHPRTMLDALLASDTVSQDGDTITLKQSSYQPLAGSEDQLAYLTHNLGDHLSAATDNVRGQTPPHFERAVHYSGLTAAQIETLRAEHAEGQMALFKSLSVRAAEMKALPRENGPHRFRAGAFFYPTSEET